MKRLFRWAATSQTTLPKPEVLNMIPEPNNSAPKSLYTAGGTASFIFILYSIVTMVILSVYGGQPTTALEAFSMLQTNRLLGLLRMDLLTVIFIPLYYVIFLGIFLALNGRNDTRCIIALIAIFVGITLLLATPSVLSMMTLSDKYALAATEIEKISC